jgi:WD40 repeat protein
MRPRRLFPLVLWAVGLAAGCSSSSPDEEVLAAYRTFRQAVADRDLAAVNRAVARERRSAAGESEAGVLLELASAMAPADPRLVRVTVDGDSARVALEAEVDGEPIPGEAVLVRQDGAWKLHEERWHLTLDLTGDLAASLASRAPASGPAWKAHYGGVTRLIFLPDGERLASIGINDRRLRVWDRGGVLLGEAECSERPSDLAFLARTGELAVVDAAGGITVWPLGGSTLGKPRTLSGTAGPTAHIAASRDGSVLATSGYRNPVRLWNPAAGTVKELSGSASMRGLAFSPREPLLAAGGYGRTWTLFEVDPRKLSAHRSTIKIPKVSEQSDAWSVAWSPDGTRVLTGHMDSSITLWLARERRELHNFYVRDSGVHAVAFSGDGSVFATGHSDGFIFLWDTESAGGLSKLEAHDGAVESVAFSPTEGDLLASGGADGRIVLWR